MSEEKVLRVPAKLEDLKEILDFVGSVLDANDCSPQADTQLRMALEEIYVNVTRYAYPSGDGWAEIRCGVDNGVATIEIIDGGTPFDPLAKPDPDTLLSGEERQIGGLGIFMVKSMVDEVKYEYSDGCNRLTMRKQI